MSEWEQAEKEAAAFYALARNAFDVLMRRRWLVECITPPCDGFPDGPGWTASFHGMYMDPNECMLPGGFPDPFTALVEADKWYRENVEAVRPETPKE